MDHMPIVNPRLHLPHSWSRKRTCRHCLTANSPISARLPPTLPFLLSTSHTLEDVPTSIFSDDAATYYASKKSVIKGLSSLRLLKAKIHGSSGMPSAHGCASPQTSKESATKSHSYISSLTSSVQASGLPTNRPQTS